MSQLFPILDKNLKLIIMKNLFKIRNLTVLLCLFVLSISCNDDDDPAPPVDNSITGLASETPDLSILVKALQRAELAGTLQASGTYTVFAPTNTAFTAFLATTPYATIDEVPKEALTQILLNHVITTKLIAADLTTSYIKTLAKGSASATNTLSMYVNTSTGVELNGGATVTTPNIMASNGVIHIVNQVIGLPTIVTHATANSNFTTLVGLLDGQGLVPTLDGTASSPFTVFAPTNGAFTTFETQNPGTLASLTSAQVTSVLTYHVVAGANVLSTEIPTTPITTLETGTFTIAGTVITDEEMRNTNIVAFDIQCSNGVIHVIDNVLLPML
jgi:uncharacterized surface protein with fasciclin (FAS1) repeats